MMGWPFGPKRTSYDPSATRPAQDRPWDQPLDFLQLAFNEGGRQLAGAAARVAPDSWGIDGPLEAFADGREAANNGVIMDRLKRAGMSLEGRAQIDPNDHAVRTETFREGSPYNPQAGGVEGWRAAGDARARDWNTRAEEAGLALLQDPDAPIHRKDPLVAENRGRGLMFGRRR